MNMCTYIYTWAHGHACRHHTHTHTENKGSDLETVITRLYLFKLLLVILDRDCLFSDGFWAHLRPLIRKISLRFLGAECLCSLTKITFQMKTKFQNEK